MTDVTVELVKKLRDQTGAGMMACKTALVEARGDFDEAVAILRKRGLASAAKKAGRPTKEGLIGHRLSGEHAAGILVEVDCESDFVARTDDFHQLVDDVLDAIERAGAAADDGWLSDPEGPVRKRVAATIAKVGENMAVPRFVRYAGQGYVNQYIHLGGKLGVQIEWSGVTPALAGHPEFTILAKDVAMHVAFARPFYLSRDQVPADVVEKERAIYRAQIEGSGKPPQVLDKIVEGKLGGFYKTIVLPDGEWFRDPKIAVSEILASARKTLGAPIAISRFAWMRVGEPPV